ncbi:signal peptidase II [Richelia intracellularis]|nr:signal peptidase II [Richelia intracellularis]HAE06068.1 lipoprotein signal peptidase [Richelia sp.]
MYFKNRFFWIIGSVTFVLDQLAKYLIVRTFSLKGSFPIIPEIFHFTYVTNTGAAFSLFNGNVESLRWLSLIVSFALMAIAIWGPRLSFWEKLGYGCILGGAMGNGIDRFISGYVIDFLDFRLINFPIFNLADVFINIGIISLLISAFSQTPNK